MAAATCLAILAIMFFFFVTELLPPIVTSMGGAIAVGISGIVPIKAVTEGFANSMVVLLASMYVVGSAMFHTGLAQRIGETIVRKVGRDENSLMIGSMMAGAVLSSVLSNTGTTASLLPVVSGSCSASRISPQRQLIPLAFGCGLGGIITIIGTPPNIIVSGALEHAGFQSFGFFEVAWVGVPLTLVGIIFMMLLGKRFLPSGNATGEGIDEDAAVEAQASVNSRKKMYTAAVVCAVTLIMLAIESKIIPMHIIALIAALLLVAAGCLTEKQAISDINWSAIVMFASMMPVATALEKSGAGKRIAEKVAAIMGESPDPIIVISSIFILTCILTQFMLNTTLTVILCPIGIAVAKEIGADPHAVLMTIAVAASCAFATPMGTLPNRLVMRPGGYKFRDYAIVGIPLILVCFLISLLVIPIVWPLFPE